MRLLIVDDEPAIREAVAYSFQREGFDVSTADDAREALQAARERRPHLIVLDVMLPSGSGFDICRTLRSESKVPIILLSARADEFDRTLGLDLGADDYVVKPFSMRELIARARSILRRGESVEMGTRAPIRIGDLFIEPDSRKITRNGRALDLSPRASALLIFLATNPGRVFSRDTLLDRVWGHDDVVTERTIDVHIRWIRRQIEEDPANPRLVETVRGVGYRFLGGSI